MSKSIYLINPASDFPTYFGSESYDGYGFKPATTIGDLATTTIAAMMSGQLDVIIADESISPIDYSFPADFIGITGKISQRNRMLDIAREFRKRGKVVLIGGPYASLSPESLRPHCDILVRGEVENIIDQISSDLVTGRWKEEYVGDKPDLNGSILPLWEHYPNERALLGAVQTSRGCPFQCEFCDVIQYLGRKQRHKPIPQVLRELDLLYRCGYRSVFLADDNFTVVRNRAKELLAALKEWNCSRTDGKVSFTTQVSIDSSRDDELLRMCAEAGLTSVFIGIETSNETSLSETKKYQNLNLNLSEQVQRFLDNGIYVFGGMIVGFDSDGPDVFERQYQFAMSTSIPIFSIGALVAPEATPLYDRMKKADRLVSGGSEMAATPWDTNMIPRQMTREQLLGGTQWLCNSLYHPTAFGERVLKFINNFGDRRDPRGMEPSRYFTSGRPVEADILALTRKIVSLGPEEETMWNSIIRATARKRSVREFVVQILGRYLQIRYMYKKGSFWNGDLALTS